MRKKLLTLGCLICAILFGCCCGYIFWYFNSEKENGEIYEELQERVETTPTAAPTVTDVPVTEQPEPAEEIPIDFAALQEVNPDIYAWIRIEGTNIDYPVVQSSTDDSYYLNHTIEGKEGYPGSIYTESVNSKDFSDFNTILYGHNMRDGSMFQNLHNYEDSAYMAEHPEVIIYTPDHVYRYQIFAAVTYSDVHLYHEFDYTTESGRQAFLDSILSSRGMSDTIRDDVPVSADDKFLTLSTCIGGQSDKRLIVEAVLQSE